MIIDTDEEQDAQQSTHQSDCLSFEEVGGFDENLAITYNDVDLCLKIRDEGYLIIYTPYAELYHHESKSMGYNDSHEKRELHLKDTKYIREKWGEVIDRGYGLINYTLNCTHMCRVDCNEFSYVEVGTEAALTELILCGTFNGENITYMENHTLGEWVEKILEEGEVLHYDTNITLKDIKVIPRNAFNFATIVEMEIRVNDEGDMCFYQETPTQTISITSIIPLTF